MDVMGKKLIIIGRVVEKVKSIEWEDNMNKISLAFLFVLLFSLNSYAINLDSPPEPKKITVRSEIERGKSAAFKCIGKRGSSCVGNVLSNEMKNNTDTDAFKLGAKIIGWWLANSYQDKELAGAYFRGFSAIQKEMDIDDETLCSIVSLDSKLIIPELNKYR